MQRRRWGLDADDHRDEWESGAYDECGAGGSAVPPPPDYTDGNAEAQTVDAGNADDVYDDDRGLNGFSGVVTLGASGLPAGATASFSPATVTGRGVRR